LTQRKPTRFLGFAGSRDEFCCGGMTARAEIVRSSRVCDNRKALRAKSIETATKSISFALHSTTSQPRVKISLEVWDVSHERRKIRGMTVALRVSPEN